MKQTTVFTTTISINLAQWLDHYAKKQKVTKRTILETALQKYQKALKKKELSNAFLQASNDHDIQAMTEEGWDDYNKQLY